MRKENHHFGRGAASRSVVVLPKVRSGTMKPRTFFRTFCHPSFLDLRVLSVEHEVSVGLIATSRRVGVCVSGGSGEHGPRQGADDSASCASTRATRCGQDCYRYRSARGLVYLDFPAPPYGCSRRPRYSQESKQSHKGLRRRRRRLRQGLPRYLARRSCRQENPWPFCHACQGN